MIFQLNLAAIVAIGGQAAWRKTKLIIIRDIIFVPIQGKLGIILRWWVVALTNHEVMPTPLGTLAANLDYILHPFDRRELSHSGFEDLLLASLRRVLIGFLLGAASAIPAGFSSGMSKSAILALNPINQLF